jgi:hypothetical protein
VVRLMLRGVAAENLLFMHYGITSRDGSYRFGRHRHPSRKRRPERSTGSLKHSYATHQRKRAVDLSHKIDLTRRRSLRDFNASYGE